MQFLKREGIPVPILLAMQGADSSYQEQSFLHLQHIEYDEQYSVTTLNKSPRQNHLYRRHHKEITVDPIDRFYLLNGSIVHYILEKYPEAGTVTEIRKGCLFTYRGKRIYLHGQVDIWNQDQKGIDDWKNISVFALQFPKDDYVAQLNMLRYIWHRNNEEINRLRNIYYFRDWSRTEASRSAEYPQSFIKIQEQPVWSIEQTEKYIVDRLRLHSQHVNTPDDELPYCSDAERWTRGSCYNIISKTKKGEWSQKGSGRAPTEKEAHDLAKQKGIMEYKLDFIKGEPVRCGFCDVSPFCNQRQRELAKI